MMQKVWRFLITLKALGYQRALATLQHRCQKKIQEHVAKPLLAIEWRFLQLEGFTQSSKLSFLEALAQHSDHKELLVHADRYAHNCFALLGSPEQCFMEMPWYKDVRLQAKNPLADCSFDRSTYYKNIAITVHHGSDLGKDIKVPWELARFQYTPVLGLAYQITNNRNYAAAAQQQITSWLDANQFGYGIHWVNGMEVAIRATNWIITLQWLQEYFVKDTVFYERLVCSLYDHMRYLEHNWEWYDGRTNNHYLANVVGYAYLCWFFKSMPAMKQKWQWCYDQLLHELSWQVFDEGTSYEGSTSYHQLVTELFVHGFLVAQEKEEVLADAVRKKLERMLLFIEQCKPSCHQKSILIGDEDSGLLLDKHIGSLSYFSKQLRLSQIEEQLLFNHYYKNFGLSLFRSHDWHVSLRHHAYTQRQPTGHFHHDAGSITLAHQGMPILVDPGTYIYTASADWRNYFRSAAVHNTVYTDAVINSDSLFVLPLDASYAPDIFMHTSLLFTTGNIQRTVIVEKNKVRIIDECQFTQPQLIEWNFTFAPRITLCKDDDNWCVMSNNKTAINYSSSLILRVENSYLSSYYGHLKKTVSLKAVQEITNHVIEHTFIAKDIKMME